MTPREVAPDHLFHRECGEGAPVVLLHGSASSGAQWKATADTLSDRYRVVTPDLPGYGRSHYDPARPVNALASDAAAVIGLIERIDEPVHLVGHSFGATVAVKVAMAAGALLRSLTVYEPAAFHMLRDGAAGDRKVYAEIAAVEGYLAACAQDGDAHAGMRHFIDYWNGEGTWARLNDTVRHMYAGEIGHVLRDFAAGRKETWPQCGIAGVSCPTFAYMGLASPAPGQRTTELLAETVPGATLTMLAGAGHMGPLTHAHILAPMFKRNFAAVDAVALERGTAVTPRAA